MTTVAYPPPDHVLRDLGFEVIDFSDGGGRARMPLVEALAGPGGNVHLGALATLVDAVGGGIAGRAIAPNWMATGDLTLHVVGPVPAESGREIHAVGRLRRAGRTTVVVDVDLLLADTIVAVASMTFAVLPRREGNPNINNLEEKNRITFTAPGGGFTEPLFDAVGIHDVAGAPGAVEMERTAYVVNSLNVQGGVIATLLEAGALRAVDDQRPPLEAVQIEINYLAIVRDGPARTYPRVLKRDDDHAVVALELFDHGNDDRRTTVARVVLTGVAGR
jgi:uncharacterized protein (TIGR00369 family)